MARTGFEELRKIVEQISVHERKIPSYEKISFWTRMIQSGYSKLSSKALLVGSNHMNNVWNQNKYREQHWQDNR
jgi:hypothetical protein